MKANFKTLFLASAALLMGLTACNNGEVVDNIDTTETKTVRLGLGFDGPRTYASATNQEAGDIALVKAHLFFATAGGVITDVFEITETSSPTIMAITDSEVSFTVSSVASRVVVVGNYMGTGLNSIGRGSNVSAIEAVNLAVENQAQSKTSGTLNGSDYTNAVHMYRDIVLESSGNTDVQLLTNVARIEIDKISATKTESTIESFTVGGIFINGFLTSANIKVTDPVAGNDIAGAYKFNGAENRTDADFTPSATIYPTESDGVFYDFGTLASSTSKVADVADKVWAYNLFAPKSSDSSPNDMFPHIVILLKSVVIGTEGSTTNVGDRYITIDAVTGTDKMEAGNIYIIGDVVFDETCIGVQPYQTKISVPVTVKPAKWTTVTVTPNL